MNQHNPSKNTCYFLIGPSGSGKSTMVDLINQYNDQINRPHCLVFSLDACRHQFYHPTDYKIAFQQAVADKDFSSRANHVWFKILKQAIETNRDIVIDNTNLSVKTRHQYLKRIKDKFTTVGINFAIPLDVLIARQLTRGDKCVPAEAVTRQFHAVQPGTNQEFDQVINLVYTPQ